MSDFGTPIDPPSSWADVPSLTTEALARGGALGAMNAQATALAARLKYLKALIEAVEADIDGVVETANAASTTAAAAQTAATSAVDAVVAATDAAALAEEAANQAIADAAEARNAANTVSASLASKAVKGAIGLSGLTMATARLLGRATAGTGAVQEITVGANLTLSGGSLSAAGFTLTSAGIVTALGYTPADASLSVLANAVVSISNAVLVGDTWRCTVTRANGTTFTFNTWNGYSGGGGV